MTEHKALRELDAAAGTETKELEGAPDWALDLFKSIELNSEHIEQLAFLEKALIEEFEERVERNAALIEQIGKQGGATTQLGGGADVEGSNGTHPRRKFDEAWDETFQIDRAR